MITLRQVVANQAQHMPCSSVSTSWAWVSPTGVFFILKDSEHHSQWALRWLQRNNPSILESSAADEYVDPAEFAFDFFFQQGWISIHNVFSFAMPFGFKRTLPNEYFTQLIKCVVSNDIDPEQHDSHITIIFVHPDGTSDDKITRISIADFVNKYGGRIWVNRLFKALEEKNE